MRYAARPDSTARRRPRPRGGVLLPAARRPSRVARFDPPGLLFFDLGGTRLLLDRNAPSALLYLGVDDVHATVDAIREEVRVVASRTRSSPTRTTASDPPGHEEWQAFVEDSEGNTVGLIGFVRPVTG